MAETNHKNWRELCSAALNAVDPDELLEIVQELNKALKREEEVRRDSEQLSSRLRLPRKPMLAERDAVGSQTPFLLRFFDSYLKNSDTPEWALRDLEA